MYFESRQVIVANYDRPPSWKKRVGGSVLVALGVTIVGYQLLAALRFLY